MLLEVQRYPWVCIPDGKHELEIVDEVLVSIVFIRSWLWWGMVDCSCGFCFWQAWSPFNFGSDVDSGEKDISVRSLCKDWLSPPLLS